MFYSFISYIIKLYFTKQKEKIEIKNLFHCFRLKIL